MSNSRKESDWKNTVFIRSVEDIIGLKNQPSDEQGKKGTDMQVWGSGELAQLLLKNDLVDEIKLKIHPLILGKGKKLFDKGKIAASFTLIESTVTSTGIILAHYKRVGKVKISTVRL